MMRRLVFSGVMLLGLGLGGCALFKGGTDANGNPTPAPITKVVDGLASAFGFGWVTTIIGIGTTAYAAVKAKGWKAAAVSTIGGIEEWKSDPAKMDAWESLKPILEKNHLAAQAIGLVDSVLGNTGTVNASGSA